VKTWNRAPYQPTHHARHARKVAPPGGREIAVFLVAAIVLVTVAIVTAIRVVDWQNPHALRFVFGWPGLWLLLAGMATGMLYRRVARHAVARRGR
jgi:hypothetical protein